MVRTRTGALALLAGGLLAGCGAAASPTTNPASTDTATATASATSAAAATPSPTGAPTALDPCQVVSAAEASALTGAAYSAGQEATNGTGKTCTYGAMTLNVFIVDVAQASDAASAQAEWSQEEASVNSDIQGAAAGQGITYNLNDTSISGADRAATGSFSKTLDGEMFSGSAVYLIKGATFLAFSDLNVGHQAPGTAAMEAQAQTSLGRVS